MKNIDQKIADALRQAAPESDVTAEPNLAEELITAFRGRNQCTNALAFFFSLVGLGPFIWSAWKFHHAPEVRDQPIWGGFCFLMSSLFRSLRFGSGWKCTVIAC